ncbi:unnamed protein product [Ranitomeya imitator]|uniref:PX domain-containing protein n=1 Tax=Ranitomeya imitator TaxID=111125 RepID=A0ABN9KU27_9NEOB|nr:unnamed protein product [Ranitomeya imitator]
MLPSIQCRGEFIFGPVLDEILEKTADTRKGFPTNSFQRKSFCPSGRKQFVSTRTRDPRWKVPRTKGKNLNYNPFSFLLIPQKYLEDNDARPQSKEVITPVPQKEVVQEASKENGLFLDDDDQDLFAESSVKLSVDSSRTNQKKETPLSTPALIAAASATSKQKTYEELEEEEQEDQFELNISITDPEKIGDGMNAYVAYQVSTQTNLPMFRSKHFTVRRRFSDFLGLFEKLSEKHTHQGIIIAPPPEKSLIGMTKVKVGKEDSSSAEFLERRRAALERYLQRVVSHPTLLQDPDVREFLEKEEFYACNQGKHRVTKRGPALSNPMFTLVTRGPRDRWSMESCLCDSSPATTLRFTYDHGQVVSLVVIVASQYSKEDRTRNPLGILTLSNASQTI